MENNLKALIIEYCGKSPALYDSLDYHLHTLNSNELINTLRIIIYPHFLKTKSDTLDLSNFLNNLPISIIYIDIILIRVPPYEIINRVDIDNLPIRLKHLFINNTYIINVKRVPFGCKTIYTGHPSVDNDYDFFKKIEFDNIINLSKNDENYSLFRGLVIPIN